MSKENELLEFVFHTFHSHFYQACGEIKLALKNPEKYLAFAKKRARMLKEMEVEMNEV